MQRPSTEQALGRAASSSKHTASAPGHTISTCRKPVATLPALSMAEYSSHSAVASLRGVSVLTAGSLTLPSNTCTDEICRTTHGVEDI